MKRNFVIILFLIGQNFISAQFLDNFDSVDASNWQSFTGDGRAVIEFNVENGNGEIIVDATKDNYNIWWAIIKKNISSHIDLSKLQNENYELRIETKIKLSHAPRRINLSTNTQRTKDFHTNLMEFDISDNTNWHILSFTTDEFDVIEGDSVYVQLALMDWGLDKYFVSIDYFKVDLVHKNLANFDLGNSVPYHPPIKNIKEYDKHLNCTDAAIISSKFDEENYFDWGLATKGHTNRLLTISSDQTVILKWDFAENNIDSVKSNGLLEISVNSYMKGNFSFEELSQIRLVEILSGEKWNSKTIAYSDFIMELNTDSIFNPQPIYDLNLDNAKNNKLYFTVSKYVLNRLINNQSKGLALKSLGPIIVNFEFGPDKLPILHLN